MSPHVKGSKQFVSHSVTQNLLHNELMEKLKIVEEREKKRIEKEAKRRADLEKMKEESLQMQASFTNVTKNKNKHNSLQKKAIPTSKKNLASSAVIKPKEKFNKEKSNMYAISFSNNEHSSKRSTVPDVRQTNYRKQSSESKHNKGHSYQSSRRRNDSNSSYETVTRRSRCSSSELDWGNIKEDISTLSVEAPLPRVNVWAERIFKAEAIRALEPRNENDEEAMLQQAIELSVMEASAEESRRKLEEEYVFQMEILKDNSEIMVDMVALDSDITLFNQSENESPLPLCSNKEDMFTMENNSITSNKSNIFKSGSALNSSGGAKSKTSKNINKIVGDSVLKDSSKNKVMRSETLSDFVNGVMEDKYVLDEYIDICERNTSKTHTKLETSIPTSDSCEDILCVRKVTVTDDDGYKDEIDIALFSEKQQPTCKKNFVTEELKDKTDELETEADLKFSNIKCGENKDPVTLKSYDIKNASSDIDFERINNSTFQFSNASENSHRHKVKDDVTEDFTSSGHETLKLPISDHLPDKSENNQSVDLDIKMLKESSSSLWTQEHANTINYDLKEKYCEAGNPVINVCSDSNNQAECSYILPPKSHNVDTVMSNNVGDMIANENGVSDAKAESCVYPPQFMSPVQPQFSTIHPMFFNPAILPGMDFNPYLLGYGGMNPVMIQQMLMLRNSYFANQLLAMQEFYKACGVPNDMLFSTQPIHSPVVAGSSTLQPNTFENSNSLPGSNCQLQSQLSTNQYHSSADYTSSYYREEENTKSAPFTELNTDIDQLNTSTADIYDDDFRFKKYFSDISCAIPPPKPFESNSKVPVSAPKSPQPKKLATWSDSEDEDCSSKMRNKWYGDGWDDCNAKPTKITQEIGCKALRQPASRPQLSHFQQKKTYK